MTLAYIPSPTTAVWDLGPLPIRAYALFIIAGIVIACVVTEARLRARGAPHNSVLDIAVWAVPFGIVGGRLYHVISTPDGYFGAGGDPVRVLYVWEGGLGIWGAIAGGAVGVWFACRQLGLPFRVVADTAAVGIPLAQAVGRLGNWFNNELYGSRSDDLPWGLQVYRMVNGQAVTGPDGEPIAEAGLYHPTFLYELLWNVGVAILVWQVGKRLRLGGGRQFALYVMAYTAGRFWIEMLRIDDTAQAPGSEDVVVTILGQRLNVWVSALVFLAALAYFLRVRTPQEFLVPDGEHEGAGYRAVTEPEYREFLERQAAGAVEAESGSAEPEASEGAEATEGAGEEPAARVNAGGEPERAEEPPDGPAPAPAPAPRAAATTTPEAAAVAPARSAVVVGAGVGGLAVAGGLARAGWQVTLLERADRLRAEPTALLLWPSGIRALEALGMGHGLHAISTPAIDQGLRRPDGQWLVEPDLAREGPEPPVLVHAEDLHDALVAGVGDQVTIRTGVAVRGPATGSAPAVVAGGATWGADLVVAADGLDSVLRARVDRRSAVVSAGATTWRAVIPWYRAPELPPDLSTTGHTYGGAYQFFAASLGQRGATGATSRGGRYWRATVAGGPRPEPPEVQLDLLRRWFDGWHTPVTELLAATEPGDLAQRELRELAPEPDHYHARIGEGALVLVGDAAHGIAEHLGQGACLALEDAATLVAMVGEATTGRLLHAAAGSYDSARRRRLAEVRRRSRRLGATGPVARRGSVQARRRERAAAAATDWQPPAG